ncbi:MAG: N-formylglutamate deformylase [Alphaproteobacteria bacterium]
MELFEFRHGNGPLVVSMPHPGTYIPGAILARMTAKGRALADRDWHVDKLYDFLPELDASCVRANYSRYVADLNRDPEGHLLYPGRFETMMCPETTFVGDRIYRQGEGLDRDEIAERRARYWAPYHEKLAWILAETKRRHGYAILLDAHSILSRVPRLFEGTLPDLNLGTADGNTCAADFQAAAAHVLGGQSQFSFIANGRFKGGYITRHYGNPAQHVHALQLEIAMSAYLDESDPSSFEKARLEPLNKLIRAFLWAVIEKAAFHYERTASQGAP